MGLRSSTLMLYPATYWRLGDLSGIIAADLMGAFDGTYVGAPTLAQPGVTVDDQAVLFAGAQRVDIAGTPRLMEVAGTWSAWVKTTANATMVVVGEGSTTSSNRYAYLAVSGANVQFIVFTTVNFYQAVGDTTVAGVGSVRDGLWHHIAAVKQGTTLRVYYDGRLINSASLTGNMTGLLDLPAIGALRGPGATYSSYFTGTIDEVAGFRYALNGQQIASIYQAGVGQLKSIPETIFEASYGTGAWAEPLWVDESWRLRSFSSERGRQHELGAFDAGKSAVLLADFDRALDPTSTGLLPVALQQTPVSYWPLHERFDPFNIHPANLLNIADTDFEVAGKTWAPITNCAAVSTISGNPGLHGTSVIAVIAAAAGNVEAGTPTGSSTQSYVVTAGKSYRVTVPFIGPPGGPFRTCQAKVQFQDGAGTNVGAALLGVAVVTRNDKWLVSTVTAIAPAGATKVRISAFITGAAANGELQYVDLDQLVQSFAADRQAVHSGQLSGGVTIGSPGRGVGATSYLFDGVDGWVDTGDFSAFETGDCSYAGWFRSVATGSNYSLFSEGTSAADVGESILRAIGSGDAPMAVAVNDAGTVYSVGGPAPVNDGRWHHVALTKTGTTMRLYVDGVVAGSVVLAGTFTQNQSRIGAIGRATIGEFFAGNVAEVGVYTRALSAAEILAAAADPPSPNDQAGMTVAGVRHRMRATFAGVTYPRFDHNAERWIPEWPNAVWATVRLEGVDAFKAFKRRRIVSTGYAAAVLGLGPGTYFRLADTTLPNAVDLHNTPATQVTGTYVGSPTLGVDGALPSDIDPGVDFGAYLAGVRIPSYGPAAGVHNWLAATNAVTVMVWVKARTAGAGGTDVWYRQGPVTGPEKVLCGITAAGKFSFQVTDGTNGGTRTTVKSYLDGRWHLVVCTKPSNVTPGTWHVYVDGVAAEDVLGSAGNSTQGTGLPNLAAVAPDQVLGSADGVGFDGMADEFAWFSTDLSASQVLSVYNAGAGAWAAQYGGVRIGQILDTISYPTADRDLDVGKSLMQAADDSLVNTKALDLMQKVEETEGGMLFMSADRKVTFRDRTRPLTPPGTTSKATFGDGPGEIPYEPAPSMWLGDDDAYGEAVTNRKGGQPFRAFDQPTLDSYEGGTITHTDLLLMTDNEVIDRSNWELSTHKTPLVRVGVLRIHCSVDPATIYPVVLGLVIGDRVTVKRRPPPLGISPVWSQDMIVEKIKDEQTETGDYWVELAVTAANPLAYWILGVSALGVNTRLAL